MFLHLQIVTQYFKSIHFCQNRQFSDIFSDSENIFIKTMDREMNFFSSQSEENDDAPSIEGLQTISTDLDHSIHKTKTIRKTYEPIMDNGKLIKYEDSPNQYRKARKKLQNRMSATKVRAKKRDAFQSLQIENQQLKNEKAQLVLTNAKLETENKSLKEQIQFLKTLVQSPNKTSQQFSAKNDIQQYINHQYSSTENSANSPVHQSNHQFDSPFNQDSMQWIRAPSNQAFKNQGWLSFMILSVIVAVFILPGNENSGQKVSTGLQTAQSNIQVFSPIDHIKSLFKIIAIGLYIILIFSMVYGKYFRKKIKKI